jgi:DNA repair protein RadD
LQRGCLTTGVDWDVRCIILARPTKSEILFVQIIGRGLRTAEGKEDCLILDHSDNHLRLGFVTDIHHAALDGGRERQTKPSNAPLPKECPRCSYLKPARVASCPNCGFRAQLQAADVLCEDGDLVELISPKGRSKIGSAEKADVFGMLKSYARRNGYRPGWAAHKFREATGVWPDAYKHVPELDPSPQILSWIKSRQIAWGKSRGGNHAQHA